MPTSGKRRLERTSKSSARKARALSVTQVADSLRLEEPTVVALEEGRFDTLGAPVFIRGHLKRYAELVGLSTEAVLDAYLAASPKIKEAIEVICTGATEHPGADILLIDGRFCQWPAGQLAN